jgi:hypothetical protein
MNVHTPSGLTPHLAPERLAALADEAPSATETQHLSLCPACAGEVEAFRTLLTITQGERDRLGQPLTTWAALSSALAGTEPVAAGSKPPLLRASHTKPRGWPLWRSLRQATAAAILLAAGVAIGRLSATRPAATSISANPAVNSAITVVPRDSNMTLIRENNDTSRLQSRADALGEIARAEARYRHAVAYLMESDSNSLNESPDGYRTRLAALSAVEQTTRAALADAPNDPVLNEWYISSLGARQATLRQLGQALPIGQKSHKY